MPVSESGPQKSIEQIAEEVGLYPADAYAFVQEGLQYTVHRIHGRTKGQKREARHVSGRELCEGLRDFALARWGLLARPVLRRWNILGTLDFGRIVFSLIDYGWMSRTEEDTLEDFRNVFDFEAAFEGGYRIECKS